jgi:hypothetical protein
MQHGGNTHLDSIGDHIVNQGDTVDITTQLWISNILFDSHATCRYLNFKIINNAGMVLFHKRKLTNWPTAKAFVKIPTINLTPGEYKIVVYNEPNKLLHINSCNTTGTLTIISK